MIELISLIINGVLGSGIIGTFIFYNSKRRNAAAQANGAEMRRCDTRGCKERIPPSEY